MSERNGVTRQGADSGRRMGIVGDTYRFLVTGKESGGKYAQFEAVVPPGGGPPPHIHSREEEGFYILEGEITFQIGDEILKATAGMFANMPIGQEHAFRNESNQTAKMIVTVAPAGLEEMFFEVGVPLEKGAMASPPTPEDIGRLIAAAPRYGIELLLPKP